MQVIQVEQNVKLLPTPILRSKIFKSKIFTSKSFRKIFPEKHTNIDDFNWKERYALSKKTNPFPPTPIVKCFTNVSIFETCNQKKKRSQSTCIWFCDRKRQLSVHQYYIIFSTEEPLSKKIRYGLGAIDFYGFFNIVTYKLISYSSFVFA